MSTYWKRVVAAPVVLLLVAAGCTAPGELQAESTPDTPAFGEFVDDIVVPGADAPPPTAPAGFELLEWEDLVAPGASLDDDYAEFSAQLANVEDGSPEADALYEEWQRSSAEKGEVVNAELDGTKIHMAGFVTPLDYESDLITEFLFVPYFGACIHVPPPPVNQTVMVRLGPDEGLTIEETWGPVWVTGDLAAVSETTDLATTGYTITEARTEVAENYF